MQFIDLFSKYILQFVNLIQYSTIKSHTPPNILDPIIRNFTKDFTYKFEFSNLYTAILLAPPDPNKLPLSWIDPESCTISYNFNDIFSIVYETDNIDEIFNTASSLSFIIDNIIKLKNFTANINYGSVILNINPDINSLSYSSNNDLSFMSVDKKNKIIETFIPINITRVIMNDYSNDETHTNNNYIGFTINIVNHDLYELDFSNINYDPYSLVNLFEKLLKQTVDKLLGNEYIDRFKIETLYV